MNARPRCARGCNAGILPAQGSGDQAMREPWGDSDGAGGSRPGGGLALAMIIGVIAWALILMYAL